MVNRRCSLNSKEDSNYGTEREQDGFAASLASREHSPVAAVDRCNREIAERREIVRRSVYLRDQYANWIEKGRFLIATSVSRST
jgi:hypothetical protein